MCGIRHAIYSTAPKWNILHYVMQYCIQHRSHVFFDTFNNGNAVPMRSGGFLTMATAFPRVPPWNDPCYVHVRLWGFNV